MDRESAGRRLDDPDGDPQRARPLVAEALTQSREALAELRALSRGIAPPILADRGLAPALAAAAARSPVAVSLDVTVPDRPRPPAAVENAAYFVVTEALTNVALKDRVARLADLSDAVERVANGRTVLDPEVVAALFAQRRRRDAIASLSPRERQV